jgi:hypothetical protein
MPRLRAIFAIALVAVMLPASVYARPGHSGPSRHTLDGAWRLVGTLSGPGGALVPNAPGFEEFKVVRDGYFMWTSLQDGEIVRHGGGVARVDNGTYTERLDYADSDALTGYVGHAHEFRWKLVDGRWYHTGILRSGNGEEMHIGEVWERVR